MTQVPRKVESVIDDTERVRWSGRPKRSAQFAATMLGGLFFAVFFVGIFGAIVGSALAAVVGSLSPVTAIGGVVLVFVVLFLGWTLANLYLGGTYYFLTEDKAIFYNENVGESDLEYVRWDDVTNVEVDEGITDSLFDTGSVGIEAKGSDDIDYHYAKQPYDLVETARTLRQDHEQ